MKRKLRIPAIVIAVITLLCFGMYLKNLHAFRYLTTVSDGNRIMGGTETVEMLVIEHFDRSRNLVANESTDGVTAFMVEDAETINRILSYFSDFKYDGVMMNRNAVNFSDCNTYGVIFVGTDRQWLYQQQIYISNYEPQNFVSDNLKNKWYSIENAAALAEYLNELTPTLERQSTEEIFKSLN